MDNRRRLAAIAVALAGAAAIAASEQEEATRLVLYRPIGLATEVWDHGQGLRDAQRFLLCDKDDDLVWSIMRMDRSTIWRLVHTLVDYGLRDLHRGATAAEQVLIFLEFAGHRSTRKQLRRSWQKTPRTIGRYLNNVLAALGRMYPDVVKLPDCEVPSEVRERGVYWPFFEHCVGALDGSHLPIIHVRPYNSQDLTDATAIGGDAGSWRNRKGYLSQNVLVACDFDLSIQFALAGYQGSCTDATVLQAAVRDHGFKPPSKKHYWLGDAGYSFLRKDLLVPYQKTRYHLREQYDAARQPQTKEELFNLRHSQLRNAVERLFGVLKKRWKVLAEGTPKGYSMRFQVALVYGLFGLHNWLLQQGQRPEDEPWYDESALRGSPDEVSDEVSQRSLNGPRTDRTQELLRDKIAQEMYDSYQRMLQARESNVGHVVDVAS